MKKIFFIVIGFYLLASSIVLILVNRDITKHIEILSIEKDYARVLTKDETIDIPVYISSKDSFFIDKDNIIDAKILSNLTQVDIDILDVKNQKQEVKYKEKSYYLYYFELDFSSIYSLGLSLDFTHASIQLKYNNDEELILNIGDLNLLFTEIIGSNHIDYTRMYSINDDSSIIGIYIELVNKTGNRIMINEINCLNNKLHLNLEKTKILYEPPNYLQTIEEILPAFDSLVQELPSQGSFSFKNNTKIFIPINYLKTFNHINRFPLVINYEYNDKQYQYIIDDYLFYSHISDLYNGLYKINSYQYHY